MNDLVKGERERQKKTTNDGGDTERRLLWIQGFKFHRN